MNFVVSSSHEKESRELRTIYSELLAELADKDKRIVMLDADLMSSISGGVFASRFPDRTFNCGIAEATMTGVAAGLGVNGFVPFMHTFGTFASRRVFDQVFLSGAYAGSNIKIIGSDPGITAAFNGGTHMPLEDVALMRAVPNMTIIDITDVAMLENLLPQIVDTYGMFYIRLSRRLSFKVYEGGSLFELGKWAKLRDGKDAAVFASGFCVSRALAAAESLVREGLSISVYDAFSIKPADRDTVIAAAQATGAVVTAENHNIIGGLGSAVSEILSEEIPTPIRRVGVRDHFGEVGDSEYLAEKFGLTASAIIAAVKSVFAAKRGVQGGKTK